MRHPITVQTFSEPCPAGACGEVWKACAGDKGGSLQTNLLLLVGYLVPSSSANSITLWGIKPTQLDASDFLH
jgi:hypothetical protein